jgi:hypothetical protein
MAAGSPRTAERLSSAGVEVLLVAYDELQNTNRLAPRTSKRDGPARRSGIAASGGG